MAYYAQSTLVIYRYFLLILGYFVVFWVHVLVLFVLFAVFGVLFGISTFIVWTMEYFGLRWDIFGTTGYHGLLQTDIGPFN